jgi:hypothetical protein
MNDANQAVNAVIEAAKKDAVEGEGARRRGEY